MGDWSAVAWAGRRAVAVAAGPSRAEALERLAALLREVDGARSRSAGRTTRPDGPPPH
jgi:hypothetical protein